MSMYTLGISIVNPMISYVIQLQSYNVAYIYIYTHVNGLEPHAQVPYENWDKI